MRRAFASILTGLILCAAPFAVSVSTTTATATDQSPFPRPGSNTREQIKKCDNAQAACKTGCDKNMIDIDNQIALCKKKCDDDRAMCLQYRLGPRPGTTGYKSKTRLPVSPN